MPHAREKKLRMGLTRSFMATSMLASTKSSIAILALVFLLRRKRFLTAVGGSRVGSSRHVESLPARR
jgi:hypothetical protein